MECDTEEKKLKSTTVQTTDESEKEDRCTQTNLVKHTTIGIQTDRNGTFFMTWCVAMKRINVNKETQTEDKYN